MRNTTTYLLPFILFLFGACQTEQTKPALFANGLEPMASPCKNGAQGRLFASPQGQVLFSWTAFINDSTDALQFAALEKDQWGQARTIAEGTDWFVNWADFPALASFPENDDQLLAHWLEMRAEGTYDYDVHLTISTDGGQNWGSSFIPHRDSIAAEHGFVSMVPLEKERIFVSWLDGRNTKGEGHDHGGHDHGQGAGAMTIRAAEVAADGSLHGEVVLDERVCDCCQTSAALTDEGPVVVYRDRSAEEVRDIAIVRRVAGSWTEPQAVHADGWKIAGCPVNGPVVKASGKMVAVAWYAAPKDTGEVKVAFSYDSGATFEAPIQVDHGKPLGRVGLEIMDDESVVVLWMEQENEKASIRAREILADGTSGDEILIAQTEASRQSGFPVMCKYDDSLYFAWTVVGEVSSEVQTARLLLNKK